MMDELHWLWYMLDNNNIHIRPRYIISAANTWVDKLIRHLDNDDWQLDPLVFHEMDTMFAPNTIDRFLSAFNTLLPRYTTQTYLTRRARRWTPCTSPTPNGERKRTCAILLSHYYPISPKNNANHSGPPPLARRNVALSIN
jgi:hypothetical protein